MGKVPVRIILNKVQKKEMEILMRDELKKKKIDAFGIVHFDENLIQAGLSGTQVRKTKARNDMEIIINKIAETL